MSTSKEHELKCWPQFFEAIVDGRKTFEIRREDDRHFQVGDVLVIKEYDPETKAFTGRVVRKYVPYISSYNQKLDTVVMSLAEEK